MESLDHTLVQSSGCTVKAPPLMVMSESNVEVFIPGNNLKKGKVGVEEIYGLSRPNGNTGLQYGRM